MKKLPSASVLRSIFRRKGEESLYTRIVSENRLRNNLPFETYDSEIIILESFINENTWIVISNIKTAFCNEGTVTLIAHTDLAEVKADPCKTKRDVFLKMGPVHITLRLKDGSEKIMATEGITSYWGIHNMLEFALG